MTAGQSPFVLRDYILLADGERGAVLGPRGDVVWMCAPRWDSASVFGSLLGAAGEYGISPTGRFAWGGHYEPGSLIWRSRWITDTGLIECRETLAFPGDEHRAVLLRRVQPPDCTARVGVRLAPHADFGGAPIRDLRLEDGHWHARVGELYLRWSGAADARPADGDREWRMELTVPAGGHHDLVLEIGDRPPPEAPVDPDAAWQQTAAAWQSEVPRFDRSMAPGQTRHSYAVMRGLTRGGGGMVAAATTSLPEKAEEGRNFDYRYVWIRDQSYAGQAVAADGPHALMDDAVSFVTARLLEHGPQLSPAYTVGGGSVPGLHDLDLPGYPGGKVSVGNGAGSQFQLDAFGEALLLLAAAAGHDHLDRTGWQAADVAADAIAARWHEPDAGVWELSDRPWTHSRLICAAGLRAVAATHPTPARASQMLALADLLTAHTAEHATAPEGHWKRSFDDASLDAALLLAGVRGAVPADDRRTVATLRGFLSELTKDGYAYRYRHDGGELGSTEGSFLMCGFLTALALHQQGDALEAARWFERSRGSCGPAQLFSEEFDATENQQRGNLPQAFVHAYMLEASVRLAQEPDHRHSHREDRPA